MQSTELKAKITQETEELTSRLEQLLKMRDGIEKQMDQLNQRLLVLSGGLMAINELSIEAESGEEALQIEIPFKNVEKG